MREYIEKSIKRTSIGFALIIFYCVVNIISKFSYLDFAYLLVVIGYFIAYLRIVKKL